ncbi:unnamed protein product [Auanema sp. JU1783]|nr:unnamed protein product [Auanema sp. JU1783]
MNSFVLGRSCGGGLRNFRRAMSGVQGFKCADRIVNAKPSIWVEFTTLAAESKAVNLGQGFPDGPMPKFVSDLLREICNHPERTDWHQYTRGFGHPRLVQALSKLYGGFYGRDINGVQEILVTVGAYLSLYYTFLGWINHGDEVLLIEPTYDCYAPQVRMAGGSPVPVVMNLKEGAKTSAEFTLDVNALRNKWTPKTKMLVLNNPNNPTGKVFSREELEQIAEFVREKNLIVVADEVYEWHVFGGEKMIRFASIPGMYERTISIGSAGKAFSVTGWKLGWAIAPEHLLAPIKMVHQNCVFTCSTPTQEAIAQAFEKEMAIFDTNPEDSYLLTGLSSELQTKRDKLADMLREAGLRPILPQSGYFMLADFGGIDGPFREEAGDGSSIDFRFVRWLCKEKKLATIPPSAFYSGDSEAKNNTLIRVCFMKTDKTLNDAHEILKTLKN